LAIASEPVKKQISIKKNIKNPNVKKILKGNFNF